MSQDVVPGVGPARQDDRVDSRPIRRLRPDPGALPTAEQRDRWPLTVPAVAQIAAEGWSCRPARWCWSGRTGRASRR